MEKTVDMAAHFGTGRLIRVALPSIAMMIFTSIYTVVDGLFVSNFAGKTAFAAVNLIMPFLMILGTVGFMVGTGGNAYISLARGLGEDERANRWFSLLVYFSLALGVVLAILGFIFMEPVARLLGADENMLDMCVLYGRISMISLPGFILQYAFQAFMNTAGKPRLGLAITVFAGCLNIVLDFVLVGFLGLGIVGAAVATVVAEITGGFLPLFYFARENTSHLKLGRARLEWKVIRDTCVNGSSEMMTNIAMSVVSMLYNFQLMRMVGEDGVSAYGVVMYVVMVFAAIFMGYSMGCSPLMAFQYGAKNTGEMQSLWKKSLLIIAVSGVLMTIAAELCARPIALAFASYDAGLCALTEHAFCLYSIAYLLMGFSMYGSSLFTSLGNGVLSAAISFIRTLGFEVASVLLLPLVLGLDGVWLSVVVAELFSVALTGILMFAKGRKYGYRV